MTTIGGDADDEASGPFDIYETAHGPRHVGNPVRRRILGKMRGSELTVPEMIEATGLTKSTISTHLALLHRDGMVAYREDPADRRRKLYYLTARHVGTTRRCAERLPVREDAANVSPTNGGIDRLLLRGLLAELACCGLDLRPVVRETGRRIGEIVAEGGRTDDVAAWVDEAARFWQQAGLGTLTLSATDPPVVQVRSCGLCFPGADRRMSLCSITAGLLEGMASERFQTSVDVEELHGSAPDADDDCGCSFRLHILAPQGAPAMQPDATPAAARPPLAARRKP